MLVENFVEFPAVLRVRVCEGGQFGALFVEKTRGCAVSKNTD